MLTVLDISREKHVAPSTVRQWCDSGELLATNIGSPGKRKEWRVARDDLDAFWAARSNVRTERRAFYTQEVENLLGI